MVRRRVCQDRVSGILDVSEEETWERRVNIVRGIETIRFWIGQLEPYLVVLHEIDDRTARSLVKVSFLVLIIGVHNWGTVFVECNPNICSFCMYMVGEVVQSRGSASEDSCSGVIVLLPIVQDFIKFDGDCCCRVGFWEDDTESRHRHPCQSLVYSSFYERYPW